MRIFATLVFGLLLSGNLSAGPSIRIHSLTFEGNKAIESKKLRQQLRLTRVGGTYHQATLRMELRSLEMFYRDQGFLRADIDPPSVEFDSIAENGQVAVIRIRVKEGPRFSLGELVVENAKVFDPLVLLNFTTIRKGQPYSRRQIREWRNKIVENYHSMGYIRFQVEIREEIKDLNRVVDLVLDCKEGNPYRVNKIIVAGDNSIDPLEFKKRLLVAEGTIYNPIMLTLTLQFLNNMRTYRPIAPSDIDIRIDDTQNTVDITFLVFPLEKATSNTLEG